MQFCGECDPHRSAKAALKPMMHNAATRFGASHLRWRACKMAAYSSQSTIAATDLNAGQRMAGKETAHNADGV